MPSLSEYLDAAPVRRRLRFALVIVATGAFLWLWTPAIGKALAAAHPRVWTQTEIDEERCGTGMSALAAEAENACPHESATVRNAREADDAKGYVLRDMERPVGSTLKILVAVAAVWILVPLLELRAGR